MATPFSRTLRSIESERLGSERILLGLGCAFLVAWLLWFSFARLPVVASSGATIEKASGRRSIDSPVAGEVMEIRLELGQRVEPGEALAILDSTDDRLELEAALERQRSLEARLGEFEQELEARRSMSATLEQRSVHQTRRMTFELEAREAEASASADEARRLNELTEQGLSSELELFKARAERDRAAALVNSSREEAALASAEVEAERVIRTADLREAERQRLGLVSELRDEMTRVAVMRKRIERKTLKATERGVVVDIAPLSPGGVVEEGQALAVLMADGGESRVVSWFPSEVFFGPLEVGQLAKVWLDSEPRGFAPARRGTVVAVASESQQGQRRVEIDLVDDADLVSGQTARVEVEVARVPALFLALQRFVGDEAELDPVDVGRSALPR